LEKLPIQENPDVLVGHAGSDDAGVYRVSEESALVLTVDFFPPIVDHPFDYGRIAASNSLSDVYAMGGRPLVALNVAGFPENKLSPDVLAEILGGGADTAERAGCAIVGGHTINDAELKYGLAVVGTIHPDRIVTNAGARPGDALILTKPLGTGLLSTALKQEQLDAEAERLLVETMAALNDVGSARMVEHGATACTDITGFGLGGHALEMANASEVTIRIESASVPLMEGALWAAKRGYLTGGGNANRRFVQGQAAIDPAIDEHQLQVLFDPQTAGGLLIALPTQQAPVLLESLRQSCPDATVVGECLPREEVAFIIH
jgi:selenide,water dikinase